MGTLLSAALTVRVNARLLYVFHNREQQASVHPSHLMRVLLSCLMEPTRVTNHSKRIDDRMQPLELYSEW